MSSPNPETDAPLTAVTLYTDGGAAPNPGRGGYGVVMLCGERRRELSGGFRRTTNNRMEIMAVIAGLEALKKPCAVTVMLDSQIVEGYLTDHGQRKARDRGERLRLASNGDLRTRLLAACGPHRVAPVKVRAHTGVRENERCDALAAEQMARRDLPADEGYEANASQDLFGSQPG